MSIITLPYVGVEFLESDQTLESEAFIIEAELEQMGVPVVKNSKYAHYVILLDKESIALGKIRILRKSTNIVCEFDRNAGIQYLANCRY